MTESSVCLQKPNSFENIINHRSLYDSQEALFCSNSRRFHSPSSDRDSITEPHSEDPERYLTITDTSYGGNTSRFHQRRLDSDNVKREHLHHQNCEHLEDFIVSTSLTSLPKSSPLSEASHLSCNGIKPSSAPRAKTKVCSVLVTRLSKRLLSKARVHISKRDFKNLFGNTPRSNRETHHYHTDDFRPTVTERLQDDDPIRSSESAISDWQPAIGYEVMQQALPLLPQLPPESAFVSDVESFTGCADYSVDGGPSLVSGRNFEDHQMSVMRCPIDRHSTFGATGCSSRLCFKDESALTSGMKLDCPNSEALNLKRPLSFNTDDDKSVIKLSTDIYEDRESNNSYPLRKTYSPLLGRNDHDALRQQNDSESENFSSVFTKSLTSLYSQDSDNSFLAETNLAGNMDNKTSEEKEEKCKLEMMKSKVDDDESDNHPSFSITGHIEQANGFVEVNGAGKNSDLQPDYMFPEDPDIVDSRNVLKMEDVKDDRLCYNYDRYTVDEPYGGTIKDGNVNRESCDINQNDIPAITRECVSDEFVDDDVPGLILLKSANEWEHSNSNDNSKSNENKTSKQSNHRHYLENSFVAKGMFPNGNPDKHLTSLDSNIGSEGEYVEEETKSSFKKPQKVSALSVYAKVTSDVILDVKCKRFKKRTKSCNTDYSAEPYTQEVMSNFCVSSSLTNANRTLKISDDAQDTLKQTVKLILNELTDKVSEICGDQLYSDDLTLLDINKTKELVFKFCTEYLLDYRDFQDIDKVLEVRVISDTDETRPRRRKRQHLGKRKKDLDNFLEDSLEDQNIKGEIKKSHEDNNGEYRVLRSLPGRISQRHLRKTSNKRFLKRYPTRNSPYQELFNEVQDEHEQQEQDDHSKSEKMDFSSSEDSFLKHEQTEKSLKDQRESNFHLRLEDTDDEEMTSFRTNEMEGSVITLSDDTEDSIIVRTKDRSGSSGSNEMPPLSNAYDTFTSSELTKPPQLVRMEDTSKLFEGDVHKGCNANRNLENERFSPSYLTANGVSSSPVTNTTPGDIKTNSFSEDNHADGLNSFNGDDTDDGELVIDMDSQDTGSPASLENKGCSSSPFSISNTLDSTDSIITVSKKDVQSQFLNKLHESDAQQANFEDDCVVISEDLTCRVKEEPREELEVMGPADESFETLNNAKDRTAEISSPSKQAATLKESQDQDESILRTLLLDSNDNVANPTPSPEGALQTPVISNVISLNGIKTLSPSPPALHEAVSKHSLSPDPSPIPSLDGEKSPSKTPEILKPSLFPLHYGGGQCISPNPPPRCDANSDGRPPSKEKARSASPQQRNIEGKDGSWMQDPRHLKDKIKKLKNEIVYLQLMAEQKEKERIAIICFKRYKEEILRRIYKAYTVTVEDHVRDMYHTRKKEGNEYSRHQEHHSPSPTHHSHRQSQQPTFSPSPCDMIRPPYMRSFSENNQHAHERHLRTILPKPSPAHMQNAPSYHSSMHHKGTCSVKPVSSHDGRAYGEKLPAVEAMVAKATENYGVDMRNLRDGLPSRRILPKESISSTILQKVLSSKDAATRPAAAENFSSVPMWPVSLQQAFRNNTNNNSNNNHNHSVKSINSSPLISKRYTPDYIPLDMIINQSTRNAENDRGHTKPQEFYRSSPESVLATHLAHSYGAKENPQIQALLSNSDPTPSKSVPSTFTSWSTQSGGRINESHGNRIANTGGNSTATSRNLGALASVSQRPMNPRTSPQKTAAMMFAVPPPVKTTSIQNNSTTHHTHSENKESSKVNLEKMYARKTDEGRPVMYSSLMSPNSTMPYGGHIIRNDASSSSTSTTTTTSTTTPNCPRCMGCGLSDAKYLCSGCRKHWYCSPQCQTLRWPEHSRVCAGRIYAQAPGTYS